MDLQEYFFSYQTLLSSGEIPELMMELKGRIEIVKQSSGKLMLAGNGASASISSHLATDFSKQARVRAMTFNDANLITALANDCGYENWISKAVEFYGEKGDMLILISSSGRSPNVVAAAMKARAMGISVAAFTGFNKDNPLSSLADVHFWVDSRAYNIVECLHMIWLTGVCDLIIGTSEYGVVE